MLDVVPRTHPSALRILPGKIPAELTRVDNWVVWRYELRQSKWTKVPYRAADPSSLASSTDPKTWGPFDAAMAAYEHGGLDGIGIVPPADIAIVDLDHTDGRLWAQTIVDRLGSYAEVSPSGQGIRILVRATLPAARKVGAIEAYPGGGKRYCTITGHHLPPSPPVVTDAPDAVADLVADLDLYRQFLAWARQHRAQEKVERLMAGDTTGYTSASESDMALTSLLMSCFHDHATALRVLGLSGLWDEKWLRIDYADRTFAAVGTSPSPSPWQIVQTNSGGRRMYYGDKPLPIPDLVEPVALLVEHGDLVGVEVQVELAGGARTTAAVPIDGTTAREPAETLRETFGFAWPPEQSRIVQRRLADATREPGLPRREVISRPGWHSGKLILPGDDLALRPRAGQAFASFYGRHSDTDPAEARVAWQEIVRTALRHPKVLVTMGAAVISLFLEPLGLRPLILHLTGDTRQGKTRTIELAMAVFGDPMQLVRSWHATRIALTERLAVAGVLPVALDELAAAGLKDDALESVIFGAAGGIGRGRGRKEGGLQRETTWRLTVLSSGERRLTTATGLSGARARVLEMRAPMTPDAATIDHLHASAITHFGWPLQWLREMGPDLPRVRGNYQTALATLGSFHPDALVRTLGGYLAACVSGFRELARWCGGVDIPLDVLIEAAGMVLHETASWLESEGMTAADRLYEAILEDYAANPDAYGEWEESYHGKRRGAFKPPGQLCVFTSVVREVARGIGLGDPESALRGLRDDGRLIADKDGRLQRQIKVRSAKSRMYVFSTSPRTRRKKRETTQHE